MRVYKYPSIHWRYECLTLISLCLIGLWLYANWLFNSSQHHFFESTKFLFEPANFFISDHWLSYKPTDPTWFAILVAAINTFVLGVAVSSASTFFGFILGVLASDRKYQCQWLVKAYVDIFRNTPLVAQLLFWYFGVFYFLPISNQSYLDGFFIVSIRGIDIYSHVLFAVMGCLYFLLSLYFAFAKRSFGLFLTALLMCIIYFDFSKADSFTLSIEWLALFVSLTLYTTSYIAEIVRGALLTVPISKLDAATALGLKKRQKFFYVALPSAFKIMQPMLVNQYVTVIKNSSIGILIGYPELMNVLTGTIINATGQTLVCVLLMMLIYLVLCLMSQKLFDYEIKGHKQ